MLVEFLDKTVLTLGPDARLIIDTFVYDPKSGAGTSVYKLTVGTFRFISGKMNHANVRIVTPSAIIGIRGSDAVITVSPEGATTVDVLAGEFEVSNDDGGDPTTVSPAQSISVSTVGVVGAVTPGITTAPDSLGFSSAASGSGVPGYGLADTEDTGGGDDGGGDDGGGDGGGGS